MTIKSIILNVYFLFLLLFIVAFFTNSDSLIINENSFISGILFFLLAIIYTFLLRGSFNIFLILSFGFLILYAQRLVILMFLSASSSNTIYLRYHLVTSDDVTLAINFLNILLGCLILIHLLVRPKKSILLVFDSKFNNPSIRKFIHNFYSIILILNIYLCLIT